MFEAVIIGSGRSTPGWVAMRRRVRRLRRFSRRWTLAFTRRPPGGEGTRLVMYLDSSPKPGGFRVSWLQRAWGYAWLRTSLPLAPRFRLVAGRVSGSSQIRTHPPDSPPEPTRRARSPDARVGTRRDLL